MDDLPLGWVSCLMKDISEIVSGGTPDTKNPEFFTGSEGIPWLTPSDLSGYTNVYVNCGKRFLSEKGFKHSSARLLPKETVLFTSRAPIGYVVIAGNDICTKDSRILFVVKEFCLSMFIFILSLQNHL